ncbi:hypothetical protein WICPIJ_008499 [Wickerhamomyces pijperi]|uniref:CoA-binding domain-containing protein n=1 Tax=Wickerhamomyces pijperi TaxID=599730 RepID=A0A9P8PY84_WICPI|nr:hypothetical protein WICPIJ_008499 [Wickerhamomyces pijperi]
MSQNPAQFFSKTRQYLVVGASSNPIKFGFRVLHWYCRHSLPVIPINPSSREIHDIQTSDNVHDAWNRIVKSGVNYDGLSISFITPPNVTRDVLQSIKNDDTQLSEKIKGVWFQPGSYDSKVLQLAQELGIGSVLAYGDCILVEGESLLREASDEEAAAKF